MKTHAEIMAQLPIEKQQAIKKRAQELIAQEMTLRELRESLSSFSQADADRADLPSSTIIRNSINKRSNKP